MFHTPFSTHYCQRVHLQGSSTNDAFITQTIKDTISKFELVITKELLFLNTGKFTPTFFWIPTSSDAVI